MCEGCNHYALGIEREKKTQQTKSEGARASQEINGNSQIYAHMLSHFVYMRCCHICITFHLYYKSITNTPINVCTNSCHMHVGVRVFWLCFISGELI